MVTPGARRDAVAHACIKHGVSNVGRVKPLVLIVECSLHEHSTG